jgi:hypothetical protein
LFCPYFSLARTTCSFVRPEILKLFAGIVSVVESND